MRPSCPATRAAIGLLGGACLAASTAGAEPAGGTNISRAPASAPADLDAIERAVAGGRLIQARLMLAGIAPDQAQGTRYDLLLGRYYLAQGQDALALERFQHAMAADPGSAALSGAGMASLRLGRIGDARIYSTQAVARNGEDASAWNCLGIAAAEEKDWPLAGKAFLTALGLAPADAAILNNYGYSLMLERRFKEAVTLLEKATRAAPDDAKVRTNYEMALALAGDYRGAIGDVSDDEQYARRLNNAGYAAWLNRDAPAARALLARAIEASASGYDLAERNLAMVEGSLGR